MNTEEKTIDCLILGILEKEPSCNLTYISQKLKLPKTEIMKHIRYLYKNGYLSFADNVFSPTLNGAHIAVKPDDVTFTNNIYSEDDTESEFNWKNCRYIPTPESFSNKKTK